MEFSEHDSGWTSVIEDESIYLMFFYVDTVEQGNNNF